MEEVDNVSCVTSGSKSTSTLTVQIIYYLWLPITSDVHQQRNSSIISWPTQRSTNKDRCRTWKQFFTEHDVSGYDVTNFTLTLSTTLNNLLSKFSTNETHFN